jgi:hypothetical protein
MQSRNLGIGERRAKRRKVTLKDAIIRNPRGIIWAIKSSRITGIEIERMLVYPAMNDPESSIQ